MMGRITITVEELLLLDALACQVGEQDWLDYADELDKLFEDIVENNPEIKKWADKNKEENLSES